MVRVRIFSADVAGLLEYFSQQNIVLYEIKEASDLCIEFSVSYSHYKKLKQIAKRKNCKLSVIYLRGWQYGIRSMKKRYVLLLAVFFLFLLSVWLPGRVLFVSVVGNVSVPTVRILQKAEECGIYFGAKRSVVRSEVVKNNLLESMPELHWAGVNTKGCTAVISVQEDARSDQTEINSNFSSIVAKRDGIILSMTVTSGFPVCIVGQAVTEGQVLVSGSQSDGILLKTTRAEAEVFAQTNHSLVVVTPIQFENQDQIDWCETKYSLIIGKKRINLSKGSGISYTGCDKMYQEYYLTLPGGFVLPVSVAMESFVEHKTNLITVSDTYAESFLLDYTQHYLPSQMISGKIVDGNHSYSKDNFLGILNADRVCVEMIARERAEELDFNYGKDN